MVNKKDLYGFDQFLDRLLAVKTHEVKIVEDFSELDAENVSEFVKSRGGEQVVYLWTFLISFTSS